jgi:hypothetical protein
MAQEPGAPQHDEDETEALEGSADPARVLAAALGRFEEHPLFPRDDGTPETRDIKFVSFCRKRTSDQAMQNCPEDIPAREVKSWAQVVEWWGGGDYKAIAKDAKHRMVAWFPNARGEWFTLDGDSKPFTLRSGKGYSTTATAGAPPSANAPAAAPTAAPGNQDAVLSMMAEVLQEIRKGRVAAPTPPAGDGALVALIQAQATQAAAASQAQSAQAAAASQANAQMVQTLLSVLTQRPAESAVRPAEPTTLALQLIGAVQKLVPAPAAAPGLAEQIPVIKALRDLYQPAAVAPTNELQPFVDIFGQVMAADAARTQAERAQTVNKTQEAPPPRPASRPRPALVHVPGIGMVEVVAPDASALRLGDMSTEERAAAIRKDPALLRALGIELPPPVVTSVAPVAVVAPTVAAPPPPPALVPPVVVPVVVIPAVPDLEPTLDTFGQLMAADPARAPAERAQTDSKPQDAPPQRPAPALVHAPGLGMVEVATPDANALRLGDITTEERAAAIRKDPALLRALGIEVPSSPVVALAPVVVASTMAAPPPPPAFAPPVVTPVIVMPAVPDIEPTPVVIVTATAAEPSPAVSATPPVVVSAPSVVASAPPEPVPAAAASQEPPAPPPGPSAVGEPASAADERVAIALPERMPEPGPERAAKPDHEGAMDELQRLTLVSHEERVAALRKLPGLGAVAENFAHMLGGLTPDALRAMAQELGLDANGALAPTANGVAGR